MFIENVIVDLFQSNPNIL